MIAHFTKRKKAWSPGNFSLFREFYPDTHWAEIDSALDRTNTFQTAWDENLRIPKSLSLVLTPGLFAEWLPQCFREVRKGFSEEGYRCLQTRVSTRYDVQTQADRIEAAVQKWLLPNEKFIWCTHSKGGIDALWAIEQSQMLQQHCIGVVMVQLPVRYSWVIEDIQQANTMSDRITRKLTNTRWMRDGVATVTQRGDGVTSQWLTDHSPKVPVVQVASWSIEATSWADSWHKRLTRMRPQHAHDGQFFLQDQRLEFLPIIGLPELDHAQPVLGGNGLDSRRLWSALAHTVFAESQDFR